MLGTNPAQCAVSFGTVLRDRNSNQRKRPWTNRRNSETKPEPKSPLYHAYTVRDAKEGQKGFWTRIGAFFAHDDGEGGTLLLEALPIDGRVVLRAPKSDE